MPNQAEIAIANTATARKSTDALIFAALFGAEAAAEALDVAGAGAVCAAEVTELLVGLVAGVSVTTATRVLPALANDAE